MTRRRACGVVAFLYLVFCCLLIGGAWWISDALGERARREALLAGRQRVQAAAQAVGRLGGLVLTQAADAQDWAQQWVAAVAVRDDVLRVAIERQLTRQVERPTAHLDSIAILSAEGKLRWVTTAAATELAAIDHDTFRLHGDGTPGPLVGRSVVGPSVRGALLPLTFRLSDEHGRFAGVAMLFVRQDGLARELAVMAGLPGERVALLGRDAELLADSAGTDLRPAAFPPLARADEAFDASSGMALPGVDPVTGRDNLVAQVAVGETGLLALASLETSQLLRAAETQRFYGRMAAIAMAAAGSLALLAFIVSCRAAYAAREAAALRDTGAAVERLHANLPALIFHGEVRPDGTAHGVYRCGDFAGVTGWPAEQLKPLASLEPLADYGTATMAECFRQVLRDGNASWEWRLRRPDGTWSWMRSHARVVAYRDDGTAEVVGHNINIDRERDAEARAVASARLASLGEMASGLAHELRQPLAALSLAAEVAQITLRRGNAEEALVRLGAIVVQADHANRIIEHLRRFARGPGPSASFGPVSLQAVVEGALSLMGGALRDARVEIGLALGVPPPVVIGDQIALEQVLVNLVANARDALATLPPNVPPRLQISAASDLAGETVRLTVSDNGGGIPPDVMARLFEPFVTTKEAEKGTGLGLSICLGLVRAMGGSIEARNEHGGAAFVLSLKAAAREPRAAADRQRQTDVVEA